MLDFVMIDVKEVKGGISIMPKFILKIPPSDLMIRGGDIYAVWDQNSGMWVTGPKAIQFIIDDIDAEMDRVAKDYRAAGEQAKVKWMWDADSGSMDRLLKYVQKQMPKNCYHELDTRIIFSDTKTTKEDYASKRLPYSMAPGDISAYDEVMSKLYTEEERAKLEWAVGAIISGDAKYIQKFIVLYGDAGAGKSTFLHIVEELFAGYYSSFDAKELASANNAFALESFKDNPLVSIQHDGDLSKIEDNTKLNSIVSHEEIEVNEKFKAKYRARFNTFLFMATNKPVKITEAKSGLTRRLIDVKPSGEKLSYRKYSSLVGYDGTKIRGRVRFELGAIADHCLKVYEEMGEDYYNTYIPIGMLAATNDFFDFMDHFYDYFVKVDKITLTEAWKKYCEYCEYANSYKLPMRIVRTELGNYFRTFEERALVDGSRVRSLYSGFKKEKFEATHKRKEKQDERSNEGTGKVRRDTGSDGNHVDSGSNPDHSGDTGSCWSGDDCEAEGREGGWLQLIFEESLFDKAYAECPAQLEVDYGKGGQPKYAWSKCKTKLKDISTSETHYVKVPENLIVIDFDIRGADGTKNYEKNLEAANKWPPTYAELSKSGSGIHLHYIYEGDISKLDRMYAKEIEIKVFTGNASLRRRLSKCNDIPIATIESGLPLRERKKVINWDGIKSEKMLRRMIFKNLNKQYHGDTTSSVDYIKHLLDQAYESGIGYDVTDMQQKILLFAMNSTNQKDRCMNTVAQMKFKSETPGPHGEEAEEKPLVIYDTEIFRPDLDTDNEGLFLLCYKILNAPPESTVVLVNPSPQQVEDFLRAFDNAGFNTIEYDSHMIYGRTVGESNQELYDRSQRMIELHDNKAKFGEARKIGKWDIYEYCKAAGKAQSLKKWEIELGFTHKENGIPWDQPAPKEKWGEIIEYCKNDVLATEAVYNATAAYRMAKQFQVDLVKALHPTISVATIDTANTLSKRIIFGRERHPQKFFNYRNLAEPVGSDQYEEYLIKFGSDYHFRVWNEKGLPEYRDYIPGEVLPDGWSILPFFPGYTFDIHLEKSKRSSFHGDNGGEGGRTYSVPGYYENVWDGDISSQYPSTIGEEMLLGPEYTKIFMEIVKARIAVKHKDFEEASKYLGGALVPYLSEESSKDLAQALKIIINSVYGLTTASFDNEFKDPRNVDNIVAKRGNLFMLVLKEQVEARGYSVCHIKTDSIKIPNATKEIKDFVIAFGREYGYNFETEGDFAKFVLLNKAAYAAYERTEGWTTKSDELIEPYIVKTLFSKEPIEFKDLCQTFSVQQGALYLDMNEGRDDPEPLEKRIDYLRNKIKVGKLPKGYSSYDEMESEIETLLEKAGKLHNLRFIGRVGSFCPIKPGCDGGKLYRIKDGKQFAVAGSSDYRWLESEDVEKYGKDEQIDISYFSHLVDEVVKDIGQYVDVEWFLSDSLPDPVVDIPEFMNVPEEGPEVIPFD